MDTNRTIEILEALASGCSPTTGEMIDNDNILNERDVIRALQYAIDKLKTDTLETVSEIEIDEVDIKKAIELFKGENQNPTPNKLVGFFLGIRKFKNESVVSDSLYGKYQNLYQMGQLLDFFTQYLLDNKLTNQKEYPYKKIDFFQQETFNKLTEKAINQLKGKIDGLGILKTENLSEYVQGARINHPRAYEAWSNSENELLSKAIEYTNDLDLLSGCFQRGKGSIEASGQKIIYDTQNTQT